MARVMVGIPSGEGLVRSQVVDALMSMYRDDHEIVMGSKAFYSVDIARNSMAKRALEHDCDYLFMVDSDTIVPTWALMSLVERGVDVCLGYYPRSDNQSLSSVVALGDDYSKCMPMDEIRAMKDGGMGITQVRAGGMGCALINTRVFRALSKPWFKYVDHGDTQLGEDYYFCQQCAGSRIGVYLDLDVRCRHLILEEW